MRACFIGCSFTYGDDLNDPVTQAWPAIVAKKKNYDFANLAVSGGTNERTLYQAVKNVDNFDKFYIAWTSIDRFTRYRSDNNFEVNFNSRLIHRMYQGASEFHDYGKLHYAFWHNQLFAFKGWLQQIVLLQSFFDANDKNYIMISTFANDIDRWLSDWQHFNDSVKSLVCFDRMDDQQLLAEHLELQTLSSKIKTDRFQGWRNQSIRNLVKAYPVGPTNHPLTQGHECIANYVIDHDTN